ncbi:unnamed protein product [Schistocephalus solidus]|uniref:G_PROTEIN_RECEP_F1_2 domain-containing protein n=1 Tax=Schistocephalus solidus TaxID=70667 RepID=A0A183SSW9_SCHSO|nr:unnamed protein product [Schistocephalus solidus]
MTACDEQPESSSNATEILLVKTSEMVCQNEEVLWLARFICTQLLMPIVCVIGVAANLLNIIVLTTAVMRSSTSLYLCAVAVYDLLYSLTGLPLTLRTYKVLEQSSSYMHALTYLFSFGNMWSNTAAWLTCTFTIERFMAISTPIRSRKTFSLRRTRANIIFVCITTAIFSLPDFFERTVLKAFRLRCDAVGSKINSSCLFESKLSQENCDCKEFYYTFELSWFGKYLHDIGWSYATAALFVFIPLTILTIFNALLIRSVINASRKRGHMTANSPVHKELWRDRAVVLTRAQRELAWRKWWINRPYTEQHVGIASQLTTNPLDSSLEQWATLTPTVVLTQLRHPYDCLGTSKVSAGLSSSDSSSRRQEQNSTTKENPKWSNATGFVRRNLQNNNNNNTSSIISRTRNQDRNAITITLIAVVVVFCLLNIPSAILLLVRPWFVPGDIRLKIAGNVSNLLLMLNSALNFFLYSMFSARFRRSFKTLLVKLNNFEKNQYVGLHKVRSAHFGVFLS